MFSIFFFRKFFTLQDLYLNISGSMCILSYTGNRLENFLFCFSPSSIFFFNLKLVLVSTSRQTHKYICSSARNHRIND